MPAGLAALAAASLAAEAPRCRTVQQHDLSECARSCGGQVILFLTGLVSSTTAGASTPGWRWAGMMARLSMPSSTIACNAPGSNALHSSAHPSVCRTRCLIVDVPHKLVQIR